LPAQMSLTTETAFRWPAAVAAEEMPVC
jgi:hypothetical protein